MDRTIHKMDKKQGSCLDALPKALVPDLDVMVSAAAVCDTGVMRFQAPVI